MINELPSVTVFTLIYNTNPKYVIEAIESIYNQTYKNIEHIVVNDAPDDTECWPVIKQYIIDNKLPSIIIEHTENNGVCKTLNQIIEISKGKYILGCSDDLLTNDRIQNDVNLLEKLGDKYAMIFGMSQVIDHNTLPLFHVFPKLSETPVNDNYFSLLINGNIFSAPAVTARTEILKKVGCYDENIKYEDFDMWLKLSYNGYLFKGYPNINSYYRVHSNGLSQNTNLAEEDFKCLVKYVNELAIQQILENKLIQYGFNNIDNFNAALKIYTKYKRPNIRIKVAGLRLPFIVKKYLLKLVSAYLRLSK